MATVTTRDLRTTLEWAQSCLDDPSTPPWQRVLAARLAETLDQMLAGMYADDQWDAERAIAMRARQTTAIMLSEHRSRRVS
jgi:hypothetical protein